jgi:hypothetical protein
LTITVNGTAVPPPIGAIVARRTSGGRSFSSSGLPLLGFTYVVVSPNCVTSTTVTREALTRKPTSRPAASFPSTR